MMAFVRSCSLGCSVNERITLVALTVERGLAVTPRTLRRKRPPFPTWIRRSAATLVQMLSEDHPEEPLAPNEMNGWTTPILETAIEWLKTLGLCDGAHPIRPRTLYGWWLENRKATASENTPSYSTDTA